MNTQQTIPVRFDHFHKYDPNKRAGQEEIAAAIQAITDHPLVVSVLDAANAEVIVVNPELQIVAANRTIMDKIDSPDTESWAGQRLGELIRCANVEEGETCCGGSEECAKCGATGCVLTAMESGLPAAGECIIDCCVRDKKSVLEYAVRATPVAIGGLDFTVVSLQDISDKKRRSALERVFIHDLNNTLAALLGWAEELVQTSEGELFDASTNVDRLVKRLAREVDYHRILTAVESDEFKPRTETVYPNEVLARVIAVSTKHAASKDQAIVTIEPVATTPHETDPILLERILINMLKNAIEADEPKSTIEVGCKEIDGAIQFFASNQSSIPDEIKLRIFERSFSTKEASGRGLGTYSMKLFGERVLGGQVWFESREETGTTFFVELGK